MSQFFQIAFVGVALTAASTLAMAQAKPKLTLKEKRVVKNAEEDLGKKMTRVNKTCGSQIKLSFDWASFKGGNAVNGTAKSACSTQIGKVERVCKDAVGREAVKSTIKEMRCAYSSKENRSHKLSGGLLIESYWVKEGRGGEYYTQNSPLLEVWLGDNL